MQDTEAQQIILNIIEHAQQDKALEFKLIISWSEFRYYYRMSKSTKIIIKVLNAAAENSFKAYCRNIITGTQDFNILLAYSQICELRQFYEKDLDTIKKMLDEYDNYLGQGHFWYSFLGGERDLWN